MPESLCAEHADRLELLLPLSARGQQSLAVRGGRFRLFVFQPLPLHARSADAEIVKGLDGKAQRLRVEHHFLPRQVLGRHDRRLVFAALNGQHEWRLRRQPVLVLPGQLQLFGLGNVPWRTDHAGAAGLERLSVERRRSQRPIGRRRKADLAALHHRKRAAAHVLLDWFRPPQVVGQLDLRLDCGQFGAQGRYDANALNRIANAQLEPASFQLRRHFKAILALIQRRRNRRLPRITGLPLRRSPASMLCQLHAQFERLAVRND